MPPLTLNQAAREAGRSKATLLDAIRGGRLSAPKDELGRYQIDPAELFRVYPPTAQRPDVETATDPMLPTTETALLQQKVELLERIIQGIENERNDLRRRRNPPLDPNSFRTHAEKVWNGNHETRSYRERSRKTGISTVATTE